MSIMPTRAQVECIRTEYPVGSRLELISMDDPWTNLRAGDQGTVTHIDDMGQIHMRWDRGSSLALIPGEDQFRRVTE